ncbi:hypothetical protein BG51_00095 [Pseudomonas [fluorescens] ATCC 17400]
MQAKTLKFLIADHGVSFDAATIMNALVKTGHAEVFQYASTTGNGVMKSFKRLTDQAEHLGVNKAQWAIRSKLNQSSSPKPSLTCSM